jgi:diguanylate cyclase (GGDEF)-like protein
VGVAGTVLAVMGAVVVGGWYSHDLSLMRFYAGWEPTMFNAALGLVLVGAGLAALALGRPLWALPGAVYATAMGALTCSEVVIGRGTGMDQLFFHAWTAVPGHVPGRMSLLAALSFLLAGTALFVVVLRPSRWGAPTVGVLGTAVFTIACLAVFGYATKTPFASYWGMQAGLSCQTAAALEVLGASLVAVAWWYLRGGATRVLWVLLPGGASVLAFVLSVWAVGASVDGPAPTGSRGAAIVTSGVVTALVVGALAARTVGHVRSVRRLNVGLAEYAMRAGLTADVSHCLAAAALDEGAMLADIAGHLARAVGDACVICLFSNNGLLVPLAARADDPRVELALHCAFPAVSLEEDDPYLMGRAVAGAVAVQVSGSAEQVAERSRPELAELLRATGAQAHLVVPMHCSLDGDFPRHGSVVGVAFMLRSAAVGYSNAEVALLQDLADQAGLSLASTRLHSSVERARRHAELTAKVSAALTETGMDEASTLSLIAGYVASEIGEICVVSQVSRERGTSVLAVRAADPALDEQAQRLLSVQVPRSAVLGGTVLAGGTVQVEGEALFAGASPEAADVYRDLGVHAGVLAPLHAASEVVGTLAVFRRGSAPAFADAEVELLGDLGARTGLAIANARLHARIAASEERFRTAVGSMTDGFEIYSAVRDKQGQIADFFIEFVNDASCALRALSREDLVGRRLCQLSPTVHELGLFDQWVALVEATDDAGAVPRSVETVWGPETGHRVVENRFSKFGDGFIAVFHDVTERVMAAEAVTVSEERFRSTFEHSPSGLATASLDEGDLGRLQTANPALSDMTGFDAEALLGMRLADLLYPVGPAPGPAPTEWADKGPDGGTGPAEPWNGQVAGEDDKHEGREARRRASAALVAELLLDEEHRLCRCRRPDGRDIWAQVSVTALPGAPRQCLVQLDDVSAQKLAEAELTQRALYDPLTGLANRRLAMDHLRLALRQLSRNKGAVTVMYLDLDHFKTVNDTLGHEAGDEVLRQAGARLSGAVRAPDTAARLGGDEFLVVCSVPDEQSVPGIVERVHSALAEPIVVGGTTFELGASIGVTLTRNPAADLDELLREADAAMYEAKHRGRHRWEAYSEVLQERARERRSVELDLREALDKDGLRLYYQPICDTADGHIVGAEALLRLEHPTRGLLSPAAFIDVAESSDLIGPIGDWVLREACAQLAKWQPAPGFHLAVNISGRELSDLAVTGRVLATIAEAGIDPHQLVLEITEGVLIEGGPSVIGELRRLTEAGVGLAIDDFGTGYGSLRYLQKFPVSTVKIDRSFICGLGENAQDNAIVQAITALSGSLNLATVAEGVETADQLVALRTLGCTLAQGFLLGRPLTPAELTERLDGQGITGGRSLVEA